MRTIGVPARQTITGRLLFCFLVIACLHCSTNICFNRSWAQEHFPNQPITLRFEGPESAEDTKISISKDFFSTLPYDKMSPHNERLQSGKGYCLDDGQTTLVVYRDKGQSDVELKLDMSDSPGHFSVDWFSPREGGPLWKGAVSAVIGGSIVALGSPPREPNLDWVALIRKSQPMALDSEWNHDCKVARENNRVWITPNKVSQAGAVHIPRFCASIRSIQWVGSSSEVTIVPEPLYWVVSWTNNPSNNSTILLTLDADATLPIEASIPQPNGDGSIILQANQGITKGEKLRFEPQPHKNTIGYWTIPSDSVTWTLHAASAGVYSIGLLQGCGAGQGGSLGKIEILQDGTAEASIEFQTIDTGHFQNFQWMHVGDIEIRKSGIYQLQIQPVKIAKGAMCDIRTVVLTKQAKPIAR
jgi:hypothetical protein